jgi:hypothetical protein
MIDATNDSAAHGTQSLRGGCTATSDARNTATTFAADWLPLPPRRPMNAELLASCWQALALLFD